MLACSEYNLGTEGTKATGNDVLDTAEIPVGDTAGIDSVDTSSSFDSAITEVEPSTEPVEDEGLVEPNLETDVGYDPESVLTDGIGNVVTILMALSEQWIPEATARQLIINSVDFATDVPDPAVLVIRDDNTNGEDEQDPINISSWLQSVGYSVTFMQEPTNGISASDLTGFHVVIFSNPGYPPDDNSTIDALYDFSNQGYGVILQGDDMTQTDSPKMEEMTKLVEVDNGSSYYGVNIDNNNGAAYSVRMVPYNVLNTDISLVEFPYGNDIDTTELSSTGVYVAAWATLEGTQYPEKPVITAYSPSQTVFQ